MRGFRFYIFLSFFLSCTIFSQNKFEFDYARFYSPQDSTGYIELYYSFDKSALKTVETGTQVVKQGELGVKIVDVITNDIAVDNSWRFDINQDEENKLLVGVLEFPLNYSKYLVEITADDINNSDYRGTSTFELNFTPFSSTGIMLSDIELATSILPQSQNPESIFYKNSIEVTPNPSLIYGDSNPVIFFYTEVYGLNEKAASSYSIEQKVYDVNNKVVFEKQRNVSGENSSVVEVGAISVNKYTSGIYTLVVSVKDNTNLFSANSSKKVYVYNHELVDQSTDFEKTNISPLESELMMMGEDELNYMFETAKYIAKEFEKDQWNKLHDVNSKRAFLSKFWEKKDTDPTTKLNEYKRDYYDRVNYANKNFSNLSRGEGWKTDRGRVYITYGEPGEIERFQNEYYSKPYEIWQYYDLEGGVIFLFADEEGLNIYRLVHSTKKGEIYNYNNYLKYVQ